LSPTFRKRSFRQPFRGGIHVLGLLPLRRGAAARFMGVQATEVFGEDKQKRLYKDTLFYSEKWGIQFMDFEFACCHKYISCNKYSSCRGAGNTLIFKTLKICFCASIPRS
jgi:hypothetical protein